MDDVRVRHYITATSSRETSKTPVMEVCVASTMLLCCALSAFSADSLLWSSLISVTAATGALIALAKRRFAASIRLLWPFIVLAGVYIVSLLVHPSAAGAKHLIALLTVMSAIIFFYRCASSLRRSSLFLLLTAATSLVSLLPSALALNQKNADGGLAFYGIGIFAYLLLARTGRRTGTAILIAFGLGTSLYALAINFRVMVVYGLLVVAVYTALSVVRPSVRTGTAAFTIFLALIACGVIAYTHIEDWPFLAEVNEFLVDQTGRTATSGRQLIWPFVVAAIAENPVMGIGAGALPADLTDTSLSSHNYYLQVALQTGLAGLLFVLLGLGGVWRRYCASGWSHRATTFGAAIFIIFMLHNATEVLMFQNSIRIAIPAWALIAMAAAQLHHKQ